MIFLQEGDTTSGTVGNWGFHSFMKGPCGRLMHGSDWSTREVVLDSLSFEIRLSKGFDQIVNFIGKETAHHERYFLLFSLNLVGETYRVL